MEFRLLGPVQVVSEGRELRLGGPKQRALLAELLLHGGAVLPRDHLVDALWEEPPSSARSSLQVYVHGLRQALGRERIVTRGDGYGIRFEPVELDLARFEQLVGRAESAIADARVADAADDLEAALALWAGPALADVSDHPAARAATARLEELRLRAVELRNDATLALGRHDALLPTLEELVAEHPYRERLREQQILALYRSGRQKEALDAYRETRRTLVEELGVEPGPALQELERSILRQDTELAPPGRASGRKARPRLPSPATSLVGRRLEIAAVEALLRRDDVRLLTLTGPGGTGKTRLALAVARDLAGELHDGAVFVDLTAVTEESLVLPAVAAALELEAADSVLDAVAARSLLLVLDNLEQLGEQVTPVAQLLAAAPRLRVLATSRTPLRLSGEHEYRVPPLPTPEGTLRFEELAANDAVRLFAARAQAVDQEFALTDGNAASIAAICRRLDGLPLAIELASARIRTFTPAEILDRLGKALTLLVEGARDLPTRQQTLRATIDWSYTLLAEPERALLARLAVFAGGWRLDDAEAVLGEDVAVPLAVLVDHNLARRRPDGRFALLETIREYALERLAAAGEEAEYRQRHARRFAAVASGARDGIFAGGDAQAEAFTTLDADQDNLHAAVAWAAETADTETELELALGQRWYWLVRGRLREGAAVFERVAEAAGLPAQRAEALASAGTLNIRRGERARGVEQLEVALELHRELGDEDEVARCVAELGAAAVEAGDLERATELYEETVVTFGRIGNRQRQAVAISNLAAIAAQQGDYARASEHGDRAVALQRELADLDGLAVSLANVGEIHLKRGDAGAARVALRESFEIGYRLEYRILFAYLLGMAGELARRDGDPERAARLVGAARAAFAEMGMPVPQEAAADVEATLVALRETLGAERVAELVRVGAHADRDAMIGEAYELTRSY